MRIYDYVDAEVPALQRMFSKRLRGYRAMGYVTTADAEKMMSVDLPMHHRAESFVSPLAGVANH